MNKPIAVIWHFRSKSNPSNDPYKTILYVDGTISCNCNGWTQRVINKATDERSCRHVKAIENGTADAECCKREFIETPQRRIIVAEDYAVKNGRTIRMNARPLQTTKPEPTERWLSAGERAKQPLKPAPRNPLATPENVERVKAPQRQRVPKNEWDAQDEAFIADVLKVGKGNQPQSTQTSIPAPQKPGTIKRKIDLDLLDEGE